MGKQGREGPGQDTPPGLAPCSLLLPPQVGLLPLRASPGAGGSSTPGPRSPEGRKLAGLSQSFPSVGSARVWAQTAEAHTGNRGAGVCAACGPRDERGHVQACVVGLRPAATSFLLLPGSGPAGQAPRLAALPHSRATESPRGWGQSLTQRCADPLPRSRARSSEGGGGQAPCEALEAGGQAGCGESHGQVLWGGDQDRGELWLDTPDRKEKWGWGTGLVGGVFCGPHPPGQAHSWAGAGPVGEGRHSHQVPQRNGKTCSFTLWLSSPRPEKSPTPATSASLSIPSCFLWA